MKRINGVIVFIILLLVAYTSVAQTEGSFIRVFDSRGSKIYKGHLCALTDSSIFVQKGKQTTEVFITKIGTIKLRRSFGHTVLASTGGTAAFFCVLLGIEGSTAKGPRGFLDFSPYTFGEGVLEGLSVGSILGAIPGVIIGATRKRPVIKIDNNLDKWKQAKEFLKKYLPKPETPALQSGPIEILH